MRRLFALAAVAPLLLAAANLPTTTVPLQTWRLPYPDRTLQAPAVGPDGTIWFVGRDGNYLGRLDPETGGFSKHDLATGTGPDSVVVADDGAVWYAAGSAGYLARYDPATGATEKIAMPVTAAGDPGQLAPGREGGNLWFTVRDGGFVGQLTLAGRDVHLLPVPTPDGHPGSIAVAPDGTAWVALSGTNKVGAVDPGHLQLTELTLPKADARPRAIAAASNGSVFYTDMARGELGRIDPKIGRVKTWVVPGGADSRPAGIAVDRLDRIWLVTTGATPNHLIGFDPERDAFFADTTVPDGTAGDLAYDPTRHVLWFPTDAGTIDRAVLPD